MKVTIGTFQATPRIINRVVKVLESGRLSYGPVSHEFEQRFAQMHGCEYGVLSNSGTSSLVVALQALKELRGWPDGSEVIVPALTFVATVNAVLHCRLTPVLSDIYPHFYDLDADFHRAITDKSVAVIAVNMFGKPADLHQIQQICERRNLVLIEDSCESMATGIGTKPVGSWGEVGVFSFYMAHILTAGVGGMSITNNKRLATKMRSLVNHGIDVDGLPSPDDYDPSFLSRNFRFTSVGHSFRITELESAIALEQLDELPEMIARRQKVAQLYHRLLESFEDFLQLPVVRWNAPSSWMVYPIVMREPHLKNTIMCHLRQHDIEARDMMPLTNQRCYNFDAERYPVAHNINQRGFYIGCHQDTTVSQQNYVASAFVQFRRKYAN